MDKKVITTERQFVLEILDFLNWLHKLVQRYSTGAKFVACDRWYHSSQDGDVQEFYTFSQESLLARIWRGVSVYQLTFLLFRFLHLGVEQMRYSIEKVNPNVFAHRFLSQLFQ